MKTNGMSSINRLALALVLYVVPVQSLAAVRFEGLTSAAGGNINELTLTPYTVTGSNTYLVCGIIGDGGSLLSATYGSVAMTRKSSTRIGGRWVEAWELIAPARGGKSASLKMSQGIFSFVTSCLFFTGVNQRSPSGAAGIPGIGRTGRLRVSITVPTNGTGVSFGFNADTTACGSQKSAQTSRFDLCDGSNGINGFGSTTNNTGLISMSWTLSGKKDSGLVAFSLNPAATNLARSRYDR